ncbi:hypothetical protein [Rhodococcus sp. D-1]|uniref:hypothetical protein n=1 Tax=Rhodococcus sp. D-1 TaxID=1912238 RepID=UPI000975D74A|nr:hypothetical protein [Rhodococcus sp. D-1]OMQ23114.1 hypothetical protein BK799_32005 [Rhodococcus sp. D-1]
MRATNLLVERAAVAATELSLARCVELYMALPVVDHGVDLMAYQVDPFRVAKIQVKGSTKGMKVYRQYSESPMIVSYVLDPLGAADVILLSGEEAWNLPFEYIARGGNAGDHRADNTNYNWARRPRLLESILESYRATPNAGLSSSSRRRHRPTSAPKCRVRKPAYECI